MTGLEIRPTLAFRKWRYSIQTAMDVDQLMLVVSGYMSGWTPHELGVLPLELAHPIRSTEDLMERAVEASRAEVHFKGPEHERQLLVELATTLLFAATRLRYLLALRSNRPS